MDDTLLDTLTRRLDATLRRDGRYHADCPFCGKPAKRGQSHFSLCDKGYSCWVCGQQGGLSALAAHLGERSAYTAPAPRQAAPTPRQSYRWQSNQERTLAPLLEAPTRLPDWQAYKPVSIDTIAHARLGVGVLPASRCKTPRLIVPVFDGTSLVALHGRAYRRGDTDAKWLTAGGSRKDVLYQAHRLRPGATVIIAENLVDCLLAQQEDPRIVAVASGGVSWRDAWTQQIAASRPRHVLIWLDNDLAGCANPTTARALLAEWRAAMAERVQAGTLPRIPAEPEPAGPRIANDLLAAGIKASIYQWPAYAPAKADLGWALAQG